MLGVSLQVAIQLSQRSKAKLRCYQRQSVSAQRQSSAARGWLVSLAAGKILQQLTAHISSPTHIVHTHDCGPRRNHAPRGASPPQRQAARPIRAVPPPAAPALTVAAAAPPVAGLLQVRVRVRRRPAAPAAAAPAAGGQRCDGSVGVECAAAGPHYLLHQSQGERAQLQRGCGAPGGVGYTSGGVRESRKQCRGGRRAGAGWQTWHAGAHVWPARVHNQVFRGGCQGTRRGHMLDAGPADATAGLWRNPEAAERTAAAAAMQLTAAAASCTACQLTGKHLNMHACHHAVYSSSGELCMAASNMGTRPT